MSDVTTGSGVVNVKTTRMTAALTNVDEVPADDIGERGHVEEL